jgi:hypothetical protein
VAGGPRADPIYNVGVRFTNCAAFLFCFGITVLAAADCPVVNPVLTHRPAYPVIVGSNWNGAILVQMTIDKTGVATNLKIVRTICTGYPERDRRSDCKTAEKLAVDFVAK